MRNGILLVVAVAAAAITSSASPEWRRVTFRPEIQPEGIAFSIWTLLFALGILQGVYADMEPSNVKAQIAAIWVAAAYFACALWALLPAMTASAALCLMTAASLATTGAFVAKPVSVLAEVSSSLFAGWLWTAASLGVILAEGKESVLNSQWSLLVLSACTSILAVTLRLPYLPFPVLWASLCQKVVCKSSVLLSLCVSAAGIATTLAR